MFSIYIAIIESSKECKMHSTKFIIGFLRISNEILNQVNLEPTVGQFSELLYFGSGVLREITEIAIVKKKFDKITF